MSAAIRADAGRPVNYDDEVPMTDPIRVSNPDP